MLLRRSEQRLNLTFYSSSATGTVVLGINEGIFFFMDRFNDAIPNVASSMTLHKTKINRNIIVTIPKISGRFSTVRSFLILAVGATSVLLLYMKLQERRMCETGQFSSWSAAVAAGCRYCLETIR